MNLSPVKRTRPDDSTPDLISKEDSWIKQLLEEKLKFQPTPKEAKICIQIQPKPKEPEVIASIQKKIRDEIERLVGIKHVSTSGYVIDISTKSNSEIQTIKLYHSPLILCGTYLKKSRVISQTPMFVGPKQNPRRIGVNSVQELISFSISKEFYSDDSSQEINFAGAGREDVDVRVFGSGRQFLMTFILPTKNLSPTEEFLLELERAVNQHANGIIHVRNLRVATPDDRKLVLEGQENKRKLYVCVIQLERSCEWENLETKLNNIKELTVHQKTPIRVAHRRAMMTRDRIVHKVEIAPISPTMFIMWIDAGAGFYIKEFVHGDLGRTSPSVSELLGIRAKLVALDYLGSSDIGFDHIDITSDEFWL